MYFFQKIVKRLKDYNKSMKKDSDEINITSKEKTMLGIQAAIQAIPYVGSSIATLYFGYKQEIRFKRLENFYKELAIEIEGIKEKIISIDRQDKDSFLFILEELNERVEKEYRLEKIIFFKNYFKNTLKDPVTKINFDKRQYFLNIIESMTLLESSILKFLINSENEPTEIMNIEFNGIDQYLIIGAVEKLKSYGFLESQTISVMIGAGQDNRLREKVRLSDYGIKFYEFCILKN